MVYSLPPSNAVRTSLSPATVGEENPAGTGTFHLTFLSGPNATGGFWPSATPDPPGPRNPGHASGLSPASPADANTPKATDAINPFMALPSGDGYRPARRGGPCAGLREASLGGPIKACFGRMIQVSLSGRRTCRGTPWMFPVDTGAKIGRA